MSQSIYTVDNLLTSLKNRGLPPESQATFTAAQFAQVLSEEMMTNLIPLMDSVSEEYFVTYYDYAYDPATTTYAIPPRAVAGKLRDVVFVDSSGLELALPRLRPEDIKFMNQGSQLQPSPWGFFLKNNSVVLYLGGVAGQTSYPTLRMKYIRRPNILTLVQNAGQITGINGSIVTLDNAATAWSTSTTFDIISNTPNFVALGEDLTVSLVAGFDITFDSLPSTVAVGDWVAEANYSPIPQIPPEAQLILAQYGAAKILESLGDFTGMQAALAKAEDMKQKFLQLIAPRTEGSPIRLVSRRGIGDSMDSGFY